MIWSLKSQVEESKAAMKEMVAVKLTLNKFRSMSNLNDL
jgi:hypothetical protein